jgi:hypothetical protein
VVVSLKDLNNTIKAEAAQILHEGGLLGILNSFGKPHITSSYYLDLTTWRDLDIYLEAQTILFPRRASRKGK